jgi:hypothetical protein
MISYTDRSSFIWAISSGCGSTSASRQRFGRVLSPKLAPKYYGPYEVLERVGNLAYRLLLLPCARIHNVFHVAFLKKFKGDRPVAVTPLPSILRGRVVL